jgi:thiaminase
MDSLHQTVQALGITKSKKKANKLIEKSAKRLATVVATQMKKELKRIKNVKVKKEKKAKPELATA